MSNFTHPTLPQSIRCILIPYNKIGKYLWKVILIFPRIWNYNVSISIRIIPMCGGVRTHNTRTDNPVVRHIKLFQLSNSERLIIAQPGRRVENVIIIKLYDCLTLPLYTLTMPKVLSTAVLLYQMYCSTESWNLSEEMGYLECIVFVSCSTSDLEILGEFLT